MPTPDKNTEITTARIRSGDYFRDAVDWYVHIYQAPMFERSYLAVITAIATLTIYFAVQAFLGMFPLKPSAPFVIRVADVSMNDSVITPLVRPGEDRRVALVRSLIEDYVMARETYDVNTLEKQFMRVRAQSSPEVFRAFRTFIDPSNPRSPISLYERHSARNITINNFSLLVDGHANAGEDTSAFVDYRAQVTFTSHVQTNNTVRESQRSMADIAFKFSGIQVDQETYKATPMKFSVTQYAVKPIVDESYAR